MFPQYIVFDADIPIQNVVLSTLLLEKPICAGN